MGENRFIKNNNLSMDDINIHYNVKPKLSFEKTEVADTTEVNNDEFVANH